MFRKDFDIQKYFVQIIGIMHDSGEYSRVKRTMCNVLIELVDIFNVLKMSADSNGLITVKIKRDLK